jgi:hypothetical protein
MATRPLLIVQTGELERLTAPLAAEASARGIPIYDVSLLHPREEPDYSGHSPILLYGSVALLHGWAKHRPALDAWLFWEEESLSPDTWRDRFGSDFLNHDGAPGTLGNRPTGFHVRPMLNTKAFTAGTQVETDCDPSTQVWASPPKLIDAEARIFIVGGKPVSASLYRLGQESIRSTHHPLLGDALRSAERLASIWLPAEHCVMDLGLHEGVWKLVEFNSIHTSGWYAADVGNVLDALLNSLSEQPSPLTTALRISSGG